MKNVMAIREKSSLSAVIQKKVLFKGQKIFQRPLAKKHGRRKILNRPEIDRLKEKGMGKLCFYVHTTADSLDHALFAQFI